MPSKVVVLARWRKSSPTFSSSSGTGDDYESSDCETDVDMAQERWHNMWSGLKKSLRALRKGSRLVQVPSLPSAVDALMSCLEVLETTSKNRDQYNELTLELEKTARFLTANLQGDRSEPIEVVIRTASQAIENEIKSINKRKNRSSARRIVRACDDEDNLIKAYRRIGGLFNRLRLEVEMNTWSITNEHLAETLLNKLEHAKSASYDAFDAQTNRRTCTENTREEVLAGLYNWADDPNDKNLYWMNGMAGTGKTTIAYSFATTLASRDQLGASFFCTRTSSSCRDARQIMPTIAYQLARYSVAFRSNLYLGLKGDPDIASRNIAVQFDKLIKAPVLKVKDKLRHNMVVVIDALDECDNGSVVALVLDTLLRLAKGLPIKFFVTSRPDSRIHERMTQSEDARAVLHLHDIERSLVQADIERYLRAELAFMSPSEDEIKRLAGFAGNLFIYAATAVRYIQPETGAVDPHERLTTVLDVRSKSTKKFAGIDTLYTTVLAAALDNEHLEETEKSRVRGILRAAVCTREPVAVRTLAALAGCDQKQAQAALKPLQSVLHISETSSLVSILHASFPDYIFDKKRSGKYFCDEKAHSKVLARQCFTTMETQLRFNICGLESSFTLDEDVEELPQLIAEHISPELAYACRYWGDHLHLTTLSEKLCRMLSEFLSRRLLFWVEVINLKQCMAAGIEALLKTQTWLKDNKKSELCEFARAAHNFVTRFGAADISLSTPHIYISALPLCSKSSHVYTSYWKRMRGLMVVDGSAMMRRETAALAVWESGIEVLSVAYSPDGRRIALGYGDGFIGVRDAHDGALVMKAFKAHADEVTTIAYSPDGASIVSGSLDRTVRVWDAHHGISIMGPFGGHTQAVTSVGYSSLPTGSCIVSGSGSTICVSSAQNGDPVRTLGPFKRHAPVTSVGLSRDGKRIVSGSRDGTIRVWNARSGKLILGPLDDHAEQVNSVDFSPDGKQIVSGSADCTALIWDANEGYCICDPIEGHTDSVMSAKFSPDGLYIVSGSSDCTICVWSAVDGTLVSGPFEGHTQCVTSVIFSPNGSHLVSGSLDGTVRLWNAHGTATPTASSAPQPARKRHRQDNSTIARSTVRNVPKIEALLTGESEVCDDGWVQSADRELLFWLPSEFRDDFPLTYKASRKGTGGTITVDFSGMFLGDRWSECYIEN